MLSPRHGVLVLAAVLLGIYGDVGSYAPGLWGLLPELGTPWVLLAFAGGRVASRHTSAILVGPALIILGLVAYWTFMRVSYDVELYQYLGHGRGLHWISLAVLLGSVAGVAGRASTGGRSWTSALGWGFACLVPLAEAGYLVARPYSPPPQLTGALVLAAGVPAFLAWRQRTGVPRA